MKENKQKRLNKKAINNSMRWFNPNDSAKYNYNSFDASINKKAINNLSNKQLKEVSKILKKIEY